VNECTLFSEELKYAQSLGYTILPVSGYLFEKMDSPFHSYVNNLYECRLGAKKAGNKSMVFVYKMLMNSLYGRFGMNSLSRIAEIVDNEEKNNLMEQAGYVFSEMIADNDE
jgi:DNA polymerase type B, organellar and viral